MASVRTYRPEDWESFLALDLETGLATLRMSPKEEKDLFVARWPEVLKKEWGWTVTGPTNNASKLLVIEDDSGAYAGHLWLCEEHDPFSGKARLVVLTVAIVAAYRSRGWGRLLMERAMEEARSRGMNAVSLSVAADNVVARKLYEEMGFTAWRLHMVKRV